MSTLIRRICVVGGSVLRRNISSSAMCTPSALLASRVPTGHSCVWNVQWQSRRNIHMHLTRKNIEDRIMLVLRLFDKVDPQKLQLASHLKKDLGLNDLDHVEVVWEIEQEFGFEIPYEDGRSLWSPKDFVQYICDKEDIFH